MSALAAARPARRPLVPRGEPLLEARDVRVDLGGRTVLDGAAIAVRAGEVVGLAGPNGAGKSTFLRAVTRVVARQRGSISVAGGVLETLSRRELARRVAVVQQLPEAPRGLRVRELALLGRHPHLALLARESSGDLAIVEQALVRAGCASLAGRELGTLSGGERRRAFIARALAQEAPLLLLDEPTANLDLGAQHEILELVAELAGEGAGALVVLHDLTLAAAYCDRIALLVEGHVVADGPPAEVVTASTVRRIYGDGVSVLAHPDTGTPMVIPARLAR